MTKFPESSKAADTFPAKESWGFGFTMIGEAFTCVILRTPLEPMVRAPEESIAGFIGLPTQTGLIGILSNQIPIYLGPADPRSELDVPWGVKNPSLKVPPAETSCSQSLSICPGFIVSVSAGEEKQRTAPKKPSMRKRRTRAAEEAIRKLECGTKVASLVQSMVCFFLAIHTCSRMHSRNRWRRRRIFVKKALMSLTEPQVSSSNEDTSWKFLKDIDQM